MTPSRVGANTSGRVFNVEPLAYVVALMALMGQTGAMFYWGGKLQAMVTQLKASDSDKEDRLRRLEMWLRDD